MKKPINYYGYAVDKCKKINKNLKQQIKIRGFDDSELWNLDSSIAQFIYPRIKAFRNMKNGHPPKISNKKWNKILKQIEKSFKIIIKDDMDNSKKQYKKGMKLFSKYMSHLWD